MGCAVQADYDREIANVRSGAGVRAVNSQVAGALRGAASSVREMIFEVDAALCDESDALRNMPDSRLPQAVKAAAAGGRTEVLHELLRRFAQKQKAQMPRRRRRNILSSRMLSQLGERRQLRTRFPSNFRRFNNVRELKEQASALAVEGGHVQTFRSLPAYGLTNFPLAIRSGNAEMVKVLLEKETAILWANEARFRMRGVAPPALRFPRRLSRRRLEDERLVRAERHRRELAHVKEFFINAPLSDADIFDEPDCDEPPRNLTALHACAYSGHADVARVLLDFGADPNILTEPEDSEDVIACTPLRLAAQCGHAEVVKLFIARGADINMTVIGLTGGLTPLYYAAAENRLEVVRLLLHANADANKWEPSDDDDDDDPGTYPIDAAAEAGHHRIVRLLLEHGAILRTDDEGYCAPLSLAVEEGRP